MVTGYPNGTHKGHHSYEGCVQEWQMHCWLGVHPHLPEPDDNNGQRRESKKPKDEACTSTFVEGTSASANVRSSRGRCSRSTPGISRGGARASAPRYFAIRGTGIVYSTG